MGKFYKETDKVVVEGLACDHVNLFCKDSVFGTVAWSRQEATCSRTFSEIYSGDAKLYASHRLANKIIMVANRNSKSHAGLNNFNIFLFFTSILKCKQQV
jgi:hypothetical protein